MTDPTPAPVRDDEAWLIVKRDLYYRPNGCGYTGIRDHAGRYSYEEASAECAPNSGETIIKLTDAPEFSKACFDDLARAHLKTQRDEARSEISRLRKELEEARAALTCHFAFMDELTHDFIGSFDGAELQDMLVKHGLYRIEPFDPQKHHDWSGAAEPGDNFYVPTNVGRASLPPPPEDASKTSAAQATILETEAST